MIDRFTKYINFKTLQLLFLSCKLTFLKVLLLTGHVKLFFHNIKLALSYFI